MRNIRELSESGMTLVEVLISAALLGALSLGVASFMEHLSMNAQYQRAVRGRDSLNDRMKKAIMDPRTLKFASMQTTNGPLQMCIQNALTSPCPANVALNLYIYEPMLPLVPLSRPPAAPVKYTIDGKPCLTAPFNNCPIEISTTFRWNKACF